MPAADKQVTLEPFSNEGGGSPFQRITYQTQYRGSGGRDDTSVVIVVVVVVNVVVNVTFKIVEPFGTLSWENHQVLPV